MASAYRAAVSVLAPKATSFNPLYVRGTSLPPNVLLMAKLLVVVMLLNGQWTQLSSHFLPFLPVFEHMGSPVVFHRTLQAIFAIAAISLLCNRWVRTACLTMAAVTFVSLASSRALYTNNRVFCGCLLLLVALCQHDQKPWLIRMQVVVLYFGATLNKVLDADWRSGQFFVHWYGSLFPATFAHITRYLPAMTFGLLMDWLVIGIEAALIVGFLVPRFYGWAIWTGVAYHTAILMVTNSTFTMFYYALLASFLCFVDWPERGIPVLYDEDCGFCNATRRWMQRFDLERVFRWMPGERVASGYGLAEADVREQIHVIVANRTFKGFAAFKRLVLYNPVPYFVYALVLVLQPHALNYRRWLAAAVVAVFTPFLNPIGQRLYLWIARNRYLFGSASCSVRRAA